MSDFATQQHLIRALRDPQCYPHAAKNIRVIETHISWVVLAGPFAYKIKKAVNPGFLDYTTLAARRHYCAEEIRLNRRTAPGFYLDVVAIGGTPDAPRFGGEPVFEYAVRMKRFGAATLMDGLLARGKILPRHIDALAATIADFQARLPPVSRDSVYGTAASIGRIARQNLDQLRPLLQDASDVQNLAALARATDAEFAACAKIFAARRAQGFVREGHGDLHLGNIALIDDAPPTRYWRSQPIAGGGAMQSLPHPSAPPHRVATAPPTRYWRSQPIAGGGAWQSLPHRRATPHRVATAPPTRYWRSQPIAGGGAMQSLPHPSAPPHRVATAPLLFDGIEFDPALRWIDVMDELAFVMMDLRYRGRADYAWRLLNAVLEISGDYAGIAVLRFYLAYRAAVRAKVSALRAGQAGLGQHAQKAERASCRAHLALALRSLNDRHPALIITHGLPGSGKTTFAQYVVEQLGAVRIRSDVERKRLHGIGMTEASSGRAPDMYGVAATEKTYARLLALAREILRAGHVVIVDAAFLQRAEREQFRLLARELAVPFAIAHLHAADRTLRRRLRGRRGDASEADVEVLGKLQAVQQAITPEEQAWTVRFTTALPPDSRDNARGWRRLFGLCPGLAEGSHDQADHRASSSRSSFSSGTRCTKAQSRR